MNLEEVWNRPIIDLPWSVDEWREEVRANTRKAYDMVCAMLEYNPSRPQRGAVVLGIYALGVQTEVLGVEGEPTGRTPSCACTH